jgi:hypothetical protein
MCIRKHQSAFTGLLYKMLPLHRAFRSRVFTFLQVRLSSLESLPPSPVKAQTLLSPGEGAGLSNHSGSYKSGRTFRGVCEGPIAMPKDPRIGPCTPPSQSQVPRTFRIPVQPAHYTLNRVWRIGDTERMGLRSKQHIALPI